MYKILCSVFLCGKWMQVYSIYYVWRLALLYVIFKIVPFTFSSLNFSNWLHEWMELACIIFSLRNAKLAKALDAIESYWQLYHACGIYPKSLLKLRSYQNTNLLSLRWCTKLYNILDGGTYTNAPSCIQYPIVQILALIDIKITCS